MGFSRWYSSNFPTAGASFTTTAAAASDETSLAAKCFHRFNSGRPSSRKPDRQGSNRGQYKAHSDQQQRIGGLDPEKDAAQNAQSCDRDQHTEDSPPQHHAQALEPK